MILIDDDLLNGLKESIGDIGEPQFRPFQSEE